MEEKLKIRLNKILKEVRLEAKLDYCVYCNKEASSFCNSHFYTSFGLMDLIKKKMG